MDEIERKGAADAETSGIGAAAALVRKRRMTAGRKRDAVLRLLRGEPLEIVARELAVTAADLSIWRDAFLEAGAANLKARPALGHGLLRLEAFVRPLSVQVEEVLRDGAQEVEHEPAVEPRHTRNHDQPNPSVAAARTR